jgi:hypothetical protein
MNKYCDFIGFIETKEVEPGYYEDGHITEKKYYGDIIRNYVNRNNSDTINSKLTLNNSISIISDPYINDNIEKIAYVKFMNNKWQVNSIEVQYPRLILTLGGLYN